VECNARTVASKILTRDQAESRKAAAARFALNVLGDADKADDIESEDLDDWIERKKITLIDNSGRRSPKMANSNMSKSELLDYVDQLETENSDLQDALDAIQDIVSPPDDDDTDDGDSDADDDEAVGNTAAGDDDY
jgi:hypothetical protein